MALRTLAALLVYALAVPATAAAATPGVTDTEVTIGITGPLSGPAAAWGSIALASEAYAKAVNAQGGVSDATVESAFPMDAAQLAEVVATLERRFGRRLHASVQVRPELIGGIRVTVGDEVLDTSVKARLEQMKVALTA